MRKIRKLEQINRTKIFTDHLKITHCRSGPLISLAKSDISGQFGQLFRTFQVGLWWRCDLRVGRSRSNFLPMAFRSSSLPVSNWPRPHPMILHSRGFAIDFRSKFKSRHLRLCWRSFRNHYSKQVRLSVLTPHRSNPCCDKRSPQPSWRRL